MGRAYRTMRMVDNKKDNLKGNKDMSKVLTAVMMSAVKRKNVKDMVAIMLAFLWQQRRC